MSTPLSAPGWRALQPSLLSAIQAWHTDTRLYTLAAPAQNEFNDLRLRLQHLAEVHAHHAGLPNFYFHVTTAYNILRHNGVEIGKRDFLGSF